MSTELLGTDPSLKPEWHRSDYPIITVSSRTYGQVLNELQIPESTFRKDMKILDIGSGFSNLIEYLNSTHNTNGFAIDPIYDGIEAVEDLGERGLIDFLSLKYSKYIRVSTHYSEDDKLHIPPQTVRKALDAKLLDAAFEKESIDLIVGNRITEHVDLGTFIQPMMAVLKAGGEIRLSQSITSVCPENKEIYNGGFDYDSTDSYFNFTKILGFDNVLTYIEDNGYSAYVHTTALPRRSEVRTGKFGLGKPTYVGGLILIRKDKVLPTIQQRTKTKRSPDINGYPNLYKTYKIIPNKRHINREKFLSKLAWTSDIKAYEISEVENLE